MVSRILAVLTLLAFSASASAFTARTGHWNNPAESGTGYNIDIQDGVLVVTIFSYKPNGDSEWYISSGPMSASQSTYTGSLLAVRGGQCISCAYTAPSSTINSGSIVITFTSETSATVLLPWRQDDDNPAIQLRIRNPAARTVGPMGLRRDDRGVDFADRYDFTNIIGATAEGNGIVIDFDKFASCELQVIGDIAGLVVCGHWTDSTYTVALDVYAYEFGLDDTYNGLWISPTTESTYPMKGYPSISRSGFSDAAMAAATPADPSQRALKRRQRRPIYQSSRITAMRSSGDICC